ncbi:class I SAM-dependent methyltransferase [Amycolatopsis sp. PS_44_ISF1]|uniref:class I SAM-dependent methyltransferase n=1 Tax=Amycolatopsis sp. PS_44_ISF1 TaxID=2974917 RepID=UPI0028DFCFAB|nr:class I SAM-dependent methyltransferase [Amycolatopsis sp. PS_44_ISF1]MDT8913112.1 class I SAM-dependent methyltransferase [Amycolatopsis sp. PS_44_ISF1]
MSERVRLTQEKETLLMTLYLRALDNRRATPILGDRHAQAILDRIDYDFAGLGSLRGNAPLIATRARRFDTWTREFFAGHPDGLVLHLACGLDSRPLRITRPARSQWIDVDYPDVIALRERLYGPIEGVRTLGSSVTEPGWWDQVPAGRPTLVLAEGLLMYLAADEVDRLVDRALRHFTSGWLVFDGVAPWVKAVSGWQPSMRRAGTGFRWTMPTPHAFAERHPPLRPVDQESAVELIGRHQASAAGRALVRNLARVPPVRDAVRLMRYSFSRDR